MSDFAAVVAKFGLRAEDGINEGEVNYDINSLAPGVQVFESDEDRLLVIVDGIHVVWCLLEHALAWAPTQGAEKLPENQRYSILAHGSGPSDSLREPRHTYIGEDGYVFYIDPSLLTWCFGVLSKWFDYPTRDAS